MRWRCPNQRRRRCRRRDDAVGCLVRSRMLWLLMYCCQNKRRRRLWQRMSNTCREGISSKVMDLHSEPYIYLLVTGLFALVSVNFCVLSSGEVAAMLAKEGKSLAEIPEQPLDSL